MHVASSTTKFLQGRNNKGGQVADPITYNTAPVAGWAEEVGSWPWQRDMSKDGKKLVGYRKSGVCPVCGHTFDVRLGVTTNLVVDTSDVFAMCACDVSHPGGPMGCGQAAEIPGPLS
jgi:hypothetical protein